MKHVLAYKCNCCVLLVVRFTHRTVFFVSRIPSCNAPFITPITPNPPNVECSVCSIGIFSFSAIRCNDVVVNSNSTCHHQGIRVINMQHKFEVVERKRANWWLLCNGSIQHSYKKPPFHVLLSRCCSSSNILVRLSGVPERALRRASLLNCCAAFVASVR